MKSGKTIAAGGVLAVVGAVSAFVIPWEGNELKAYQDIVGVWTACAGVTDGVAPGQRYTAAECDALNRREIAKHLTGVAKCVKRPLAEHEWIAIGSWSYNVGVGAACRSTLVQQINEGAPGYVWCKQLLKWNKAGGREVRGLTRRRQAEYRVCIGES